MGSRRIVILSLTLCMILSRGLVVATSTRAHESGFCPPEGLTKASLLQLKASNFEVAIPGDRNRLAIQLLPCLEAPDPEIRDKVAFEALYTWLRGKGLDTPTVLALGDSLKATLSGAPDAQGFRLPFAALALSEVARADRIEPVFTSAARAALVLVAASSLERVSDYRAFNPVDGWRHGVAHGADLVLQLGINPKVDADGVRRLMDAIRTQIAPAGAVFYTFGEPERLARAVVFTHRRGVVDAAYWDTWFASISDPKPARSWSSTIGTVEGLARRHNSIAFLHALAFAGRANRDEAGNAIATLADKAATQIIGG